jgi:hypothetical protein
MRTKLLYAWAIPAFVSGAPVDHTWVTGYDNNINPYPNLAAVSAASEYYWYCWGSFHPQGRTPSLPNGALGSRPRRRPRLMRWSPRPRTNSTPEISAFSTKQPSC